MKPLPLPVLGLSKVRSATASGSSRDDFGPAGCDGRRRPPAGDRGLASYRRSWRRAPRHERRDLWVYGSAVQGDGGAAPGSASCASAQHRPRVRRGRRGGGLRPDHSNLRRRRRVRARLRALKAAASSSRTGGSCSSTSRAWRRAIASASMACQRGSERSRTPRRKRQVRVKTSPEMTVWMPRARARGRTLRHRASSPEARGDGARAGGIFFTNDVVGVRTKECTS